MYEFSRYIRGTILINYSLSCNILDYIFLEQKKIFPKIYFINLNINDIKIIKSEIIS